MKRIFRVTLLLACFACVIYASSSYSMAWFNERIPRKALLEPVLRMSLDPGSSEAQTKVMKFKYAGRYSGNLLFRRASGAGLPVGEEGGIREIEYFDLKGRVEIRGRDGNLLMMREFEEKVFKNDAGLRLFQFETDEVGMKGDKVFSIQFERVDAEFSAYFSSTELYVRKELKHSLFD